ncbi:11614_t:CDS:2, partial [Racocetra fulgida]
RCCKSNTTYLIENFSFRNETARTKLDIVYVDETNGADDSGDGTQDKPYKTI